MKYVLTIVIALFFWSCHSSKKSGISKLQQVPLKTNVLYKFMFHDDINFISGQSPKLDSIRKNYLFVNTNYRIDLITSLPNNIKSSYYIKSISPLSNSECISVYSLYSKNSDPMTAYVNSVGEIEKLSLCNYCDANFVLDFQKMALTCCTHRNPQHCCKTPQEMRDTAKIYNCVWE